MAMIHAHKKRKVMRRAYVCHGMKYTKICEQTANFLTCCFYLSNLELAMCSYSQNLQPNQNLQLKNLVAQDQQVKVVLSNVFQ